MKHDPIKVICVTDYFLPGFKGGGPTRTIANMRKLLAGKVEISVYTRDRDLGSDIPYENVGLDRWVKTEDGPIYYASPSSFSASGLKDAIADRHFDVVYLNSFFSFRSSIQIYLAFRKSVLRPPILLAPRGEFSTGALRLKWFKKRVFLSVSRFLGLYSDLAWHASTSDERDDILRQFPAVAQHISVAEDPVDVGEAIADDNRPCPSQSGQLRLAFISRISPMKNLDGLLQILASSEAKIELDIFGPIEDQEYWYRCQKLIDSLPANVTAVYRGGLEPDAVSPTFAAYDLFAFPSRGENFGHVVFEALRAGTPVLLSDRTPWKADPSGAITRVSFADKQSWNQHLQVAAMRSVDEKLALRHFARTNAERFAKSPQVASANLALFTAAIKLVEDVQPVAEVAGEQ